MNTDLRQPTPTPFALEGTAGRAGVRRLPILLSLILALCALGAYLSGPAWAAGAPENTVRPTLIILAPKVGTTDTVTKGTWTNSPTTFAFQWQRCNSTGTECANITGATSREYTVTATDHGHALVGVVTASNEVGKGTAASAPSSAVTPLKIPEFISAGHVYPVYFSLASSGFVDFEDAAGWGLACTAMSGQGTISSPTEISAAAVNLTGCHGGTAECNSFETSPLHGYFNYLNAASKTVGLELGGGGSPFATFRCNGSLAHLQGRIIGQVTPVNVSTSSFSLSYTLQSRGVQKPGQFEGGSPEQLEWTWNAGLEKWGLGATDVFNTSVKGELVG